MLIKSYGDALQLILVPDGLRRLGASVRLESWRKTDYADLSKEGGS